jgi:glycine dehydrogenase
MFGAEGLKQPNMLNWMPIHIKEKLNGHYDTLYSGEMGRAAHEMI